MPVKMTCPHCRKETAWEGNPYRPFCSERCKTIDLAAWADEKYRVPDKPSTSEEEDDRHVNLERKT